MDEKLAQGMIIDGICQCDCAENNGAHKEEQRDTALALIEAEACDMENSEHCGNICQQGVAVIVN